MLPVVEMFTSIQGEGKYTGVPSHFVRVTGCNLRCVFKDSICDTPYSSFKPEAAIQNPVAEFKKLQSENPNVKHVVITGGEPLMYKKDLEEFLKEVYDKDMVITIETNGTYGILNPLSKDYKITLYSVSPKLSTSVASSPMIAGNGDTKVDVTKEMIDRHNKSRINIYALTEIACNSNDYQFKFVYSGPECIDEIRDIYKRMGDIMRSRASDFELEHYMLQHPNKHTMLMPEGITNEQLASKRQEIADICVKNGWQYTDRTHIIIWGDVRAK